jgi:release factor glutamine methyltransferase
MATETLESSLVAGSSVAAAIQQLRRRFEAAGLQSAALDARLLVAGAANLSREEIMVAPDRILADTELQTIIAFAERRLAHEPVSRIFGRRTFFGRDFEITPATLDPRPETEMIVEHVLQHVADNGLAKKPLRILDIGTGSGVLVVTLLKELERATGFGTDISEAALALAQRNAGTHGVGERCEFRVLDGADGLETSFDILVCNPPYIPSRDISELMKDVRAYDPHLALDGGDDGLTVYRELAKSIADLVPRGLIVFEVGAGQAGEVAALVAAAVTPQIKTNISTIDDLGGHQRCVAVLTHS